VSTTAYKNIDSADLQVGPTLRDMRSQEPVTATDIQYGETSRQQVAHMSGKCFDTPCVNERAVHGFDDGLHCALFLRTRSLSSTRAARLCGAHGTRRACSASRSVTSSPPALRIIIARGPTSRANGAGKRYRTSTMVVACAP